jgi:hypothetical protein
MSKVVAERLALQPYIREVPNSNLVPGTGSPEVYRGYTESLQANSAVVPQNRMLLLPFNTLFINRAIVRHRVG